MSLDFMLEVFDQADDDEAIVWRDRGYSYRWLADRVGHWRGRLADGGGTAGTVAVLEADFSPNSVALFLALIDAGCILVPLTSSVAAQRDQFIATAQGEVRFTLEASDELALERRPGTADHPLYGRLRAAGHPGLVLFSSGSTGESKAAVHDFAALLEKFKTRRPRLRSLAFLLFDHIGGINTMLHALSNGGCLVTVEDRSPDAVLAAIERHRVELLPTSPTFINLILLSEAHRRHRLDSLRRVTYGTEPMPESTLRRFHEHFPAIELVQTYGLSEVGILRSKSLRSDSLWVKVGGEGFETRVVDGILYIKARSAMLGYLNAPSPFTDDGWLITGDAVEVDGDYLRILGRTTDLISVGGEKVYPAEVEGVLQEMDGVAEATVFGEKNPITGSIVCARVRLLEDEDPKTFARRLKQFCRGRLPAYKVPVKVVVDEARQHSERFKKARRVPMPRNDERIDPPADGTE